MTNPLSTLFRAVSLAEYQDIQRIGNLRCTPASIEGKWLATTLAYAHMRGRQFQRFSGPYRVVRIDVPTEALKGFFYMERLDNIGPAYFVALDDLDKLIIAHEDLEP